MCPCVSRKLSTALAKRTTMWIYSTVWTLLLFLPVISSDGLKQNIYIDEELPIGTVIGSVGDGLQSIMSKPFIDIYFTKGEGDSDWDIDSDTGEIKVKRRIDRENNQGDYYQFVAIQQNGQGVTVVIYINDINDNAPQFPSTFKSTNLSESAPLDVKIPLGSATDIDFGLNSTQGYSIVSGNTDNVFNLTTKRAKNGVLFVELEIIAALDYEKTPFYSLLIKAYDGGDPPKVGYLRVNVSIIDANDNQPIFNVSRYSAKIPENATIGTKVLQVFATDNDSGENGNIHYHINRHQSDAEEHFRINPTSGMLSVNKKLDYEKKPVYELIVVARDNGTEGQKLQTTAVVSVEVTNVNDNYPIIDITYLTEDQTGKISEKTQSGEYIARISVSDPDTDTFSHINISLSGGDGYFELKVSDNVVYLAIKLKPLDRELKPFYHLTINATDSGMPPLSSTKSLTLYISDTNDNAPVFEKTKYLANIQEVAPPGSSVIQMSAKDRDEGNNSIITYQILHSPDTHSDWFNIDNRTGLITTRMRVDCETSPTASFKVVATDSGTPPMSTSTEVFVTIENVNDNQPQFEQSFYNVTVSESASPGFCFVTVSASDPDCGQNDGLVYGIPADTNFPQELELLRDLGKLCVKQALDYETKPSYEFNVEAVDQDQWSSTTVVKVNVIDVNDNKPVFYPRLYARTLSKDLPVGSEVVVIQATDKDSGTFGQITYSISSGNGLQLFEINRNTGLIKLAAQIPASLTIARLTVSARDGENKQANIDAEVTITIRSSTQPPPVFTERLYKFEVPENKGVNMVVDTVQANVVGGTSAIRYTIESGDPNQLFSIDELSGQIRVQKSLDHDTVPYVLLNIRAIFGAQPLYGHAQVNITITDVNDNSPVFAINPLNIAIDEDSLVDIPFFTIHATDIDSSNNGIVKYALDGTSDTFQIQAQTGELSLMKSLDYEQKNTYEIVIKAFDQGTPSKSATVNVNIKVWDINDNTPVFKKSTYNVQVEESAVINTKFTQVNATDSDTGKNGRIAYSLNYKSDIFGVFPNDGFIYNKVLLDREIEQRYVIEVLATDGGPTPRSATATVSITVLDVNDNNPIFLENKYTFYIPESKGANSEVGFVSATDLDEDGAIQYSLTRPNDYFGVVANSGKIITKLKLNREDVEFHNLSVRASDSGVPSRATIVPVTIQVLDENDNSPEFDRIGNYVVDINENQPKGTLVTVVSASDQDNGENATLKFSFDPSNPPYIFENFKIHPRTGRITTLEMLDYEKRSIYRIKVVVEDGGVVPLKSTTTVEVSVIDENESEPTFDQAHMSLTVTENTPVDEVIGRVEAQDNDKSDTITYYIVGGNRYGTFLVDPKSGVIIIARPVDYEESTHHTIQIRAVDSNPINSKSSIINVNITIIDVNDNPPKFEQDPVVFEVRENIPKGTIVHTYSATDLDSGLYGRVKYEIVSQSPLGTTWFSINANTGDLMTSASLDYEAIKQISLIVKASDQPTKSEDVLFSTVTTLVLIKDKNDNSPAFQKIERVDIMEDEPKGYPIMTVIATDVDSKENGRLSYYIVSGNSLGHFNLDSASGLLTIAKPLDREIKDLFHLNVSARDHGIPRLIAYTLINVYIVDVNDNAPKFDQKEYKASVPENALVNTTVTTVRATDKDIGLNAELNYLIPDGVLGNKFSIGLTTGLIRTNAVLDREKQEIYIITVYVKDKAFPALYNTCTVNVTVQDMNDNSPIFNKASYELEVPENTQMTSIHNVLAVDADTKDKNGKISYYIIGGDTDNLFSIDHKTGQLSCEPLDREKKSSYNLTVEARDNGVPYKSSITSVLITVLDDNDNDPVFKKNAYSKSIPENSRIGTSVLKVQATDDDQGANARITYSIDKHAGGIFKINNVTGVINTTELLDREATSSYSFDVYATDGGLYGPRREKVHVTINIIDINDNSPVFKKIPYIGEIASNALQDTSVITVLATDADKDLNSQVVYSFKQSNEYFAINPTSGLISTKRVLNDAAVRKHSLKVIATDRGDPPKSATGVVEIIVGNAISPDSPVFGNSSYSVNLPEDAQHGDRVVRVTVSSKEQVVFNFASGNEDNIFSIDNSGLITVNDASMLDYETRPRLRLIIVAARTDVIANAYCTVWVNLLDTNDNPPRFNQDRYVSAVWEGNNRGTYVTQVIATDQDSGRNGEITYSIISGNLHKGVKAFVIEPAYTGIVKTNIILDREIVDTWRLVIEAIDGGVPPLISTCILKIQIIDINDHEPFFPSYPPVSVKEGTEPGTVVFQVTANDPDLNPKLQYNFTPGGNPNSTFSIDAYSGKIAVAKKLDYEAKSSYALTVEASDKNHSVNTEVTVNLIDENDNRPAFSLQSYQVAIDEDTGPGVLVTTVTATDKDAGNNAKIRYSMIPTPAFYINSLTGSIYTNQTVSYNPKNPSIDLVVTAHDEGSPQLSIVEVVRLQVVDINNNAPRFTKTVYTGEISEDEQPGLIVVQASATDADDTYENRKIDYSIVAGNEEKMFQIVSSTGNIVLVRELDREITPSYILTIKAKDRGQPSLESFATVRINIVDVNDNAPQFTSDLYEKSIPENTTIGTSLLKVSATDNDQGANGKVQYQIASGNDDNNFAINRDNGLITLRTGLDHETHQKHRLIVSATDSSVDYPRESDVTTVIINVTDINEYTPRFPVLMYIKSVGEKLSAGTPVFTAHANDDDSGSYGVLKYQLIGAQNSFEINEITGVVTTNKQLIYSVNTAQYRFEVKVTDRGGKSSEVQVLIKVIPRFIPTFPKSQVGFSVRGDAKKGDVVGTVIVENADKSSTLESAIGVVIFTFEEPHEYFDIMPSSGEIKVAKDLQSDNNRKKRSSNLLSRRRRALQADEVSLTVLASVEHPPLGGSSGSTTQAKTTIKLSVDHNCAGCQPSVNASTGGSGLTGTPLVLLIVFLLIAAILLVVIIIMFLRGREKRKRKRDSPRFDNSFNSMDSHPPPLGYGPPAYNDAQMYPGHLPGGMTASSMSEHSASVSSGRGSADMDIPEDEEIRMINATPMDNQGMNLPPDSGIQHDEDALSEHSVQNHQEYLARLGIDTSKLKTGDNKNNGMNASVESMHQFSDEGGGEGDGMDIGAYQQGAPEETVPVLETTKQFGFQEPEQSNSGSLSSVINSEEEFSGSYNWDYLLDWGPQYQPLADVFTEIARLKDDSIKPKKVPTKIVSQNTGNFHSSQQMRPLAFPPPIITDAPPRGISLAQQQQGMGQSSQSKASNHQSYNRERQDSSSSNSNHTPNSARTSQLTSMASLPKSPMSYESSFTTTPLSPDFENSLSPLQHRSPSFSPIVTPKGVGSNSSGHNTPHNGISSQQGLQRLRRVSGNMHPASSGSEQEFRI